METKAQGAGRMMWRPDFFTPLCYAGPDIKSSEMRCTFLNAASLKASRSQFAQSEWVYTDPTHSVPQNYATYAKF